MVLKTRLHFNNVRRASSLFESKARCPELLSQWPGERLSLRVWSG